MNSNSSTDESGNGTPFIIFLRDRLAYLVSKKPKLLHSLGCGALLALVVFSTCSHPSPFRKWAILIAVGILILSAIHVMLAGIAAAAICTLQILLIAPGAGVIVGVLSLLFLVSFHFGYGRWCTVLAAPQLASWNLAAAVPLGLGLTSHRKSAWFWGLLAFVWCGLQGLLCGQSRLGIVPLQRLGIAMERLESRPARFASGWVQKIINLMDITPIKDDFLVWIVQDGNGVSVAIQLVLWSGIALLAAALFGKKNLRDRLALDYLARVSRKKRSVPGYRRLPGVCVICSLTFIISYIILGAVFKPIEYSVVGAVMDFAAALVLFVPLYVILEGDPTAGKLSREERDEKEYEKLSELKKGERGRHRRSSATPRKRTAPSSSPVHRAPRGPGPSRQYLDKLPPKKAPARPGRARTKHPTAPKKEKDRSSVEAIVFIDMVGSTALGSKYGDDYVLEMKSQLGDIVKEETSREKILFSKGTGDGFMLTFPEAVNAVRASAGIMDRINKLNVDKAESHRLKLRFGVHLGQVNIIAQNDRVGTAANFAARIEAVKENQLVHSANEANPVEFPEANRILVSEVIADELGDASKYSLRLLGYFEFKGISGLHKIFQLT